MSLFVPASWQRAEASGSSNITQGYRAYIEWHSTATSGGIPRQTTIRAYAQAGEQIDIGSSAMRIGQGNVRFYGPDGTTGNCVAQGGGLIADINQEQAGPAPSPGGFTPCVISTAQTSTAGNGIWEFEFISPDPAANIGNNPPPLPIGTAWTQDTAHHWINAWHISVRSAANTVIPGRVFAKYLAYNMGGNATAANPSLGLDSEYWVVTNDGYGYRIDMNGIDPFGFIFFSNAEGIVDARGSSTYRSFQLTGNPPNVQLPPGYMVHNPGLPDDMAQGDITHKIFFEEPDPNLPAMARSRSGDTWLLPATVVPPTPQNFAFTGVEGTAGQAGTAPLGGNFTFDVVGDTNYQIIIDVNRNGTYGDGSDRVLVGRAFAGGNTVYWDALDSTGAPVPAGVQTYDASIQFNVGEVHFPFVDAENNIGGIQLIRFRGGMTAIDKDLVYYNDIYTYTGASAYDYSPCATGDTPPPPNGAYPIPLCFGTPSAQRAALLGVHSTGGAHAWSTTFGDRRVIDTWAYFPSDPVSLIGGVTLAEAELSITKTHAPAQLTPGKPVTYTVQVTNAGPSAAVGAQVQDSVPPAIQSTTWACAITTGTGVCNDTAGIGNMINTTVDLDPGAVATYTVTGILNPTAAGSLVNTASVRRPNDNSDPDQSNNVVSDTAPILAVADLELNKAISTPTPIAAGSPVNFTITLRNRGPSATTGVEVSEQLPAGLSFISASATKGSYSSASGLWTVGTMANNEVATLTLTARWDGSPTTNTAQVSKSNLPDPDSTPGNGIAGEDDQSSVSLPVQIADLELTKRVDKAQVNVGSNVIFTIDVTNKGPDGATGVRVSEQLPVGLAFVGATPSQGSYNPATGSWGVGSLAAGATASLRIEVTLLGAGPFTNSAQIGGSDQYDPDSNPNNDNPNEDDQGFATVTGNLADLSLSKSVDNPQPPYKSVITYMLTLRNAGPSDATGVVVNDPLPAGLSFISATPTPGISYDNVSGDWVVGTVPANGSATLAIQARVETGTIIRNTARVSASDQPDPDSTPGNSDGGEDDQASVSLTPQLADLSLTKTVNKATASVGDQVVFTVAVVNSGPSVATGVEVSDKLPAGLQYVSHVASRGGYNPSTGAWIIGSIKFGEIVTLDITVTLTGIGPYTNVAEIAKSDQPDPDSTPGDGSPGQDDSSSAMVSGTMADLSLTKRVNTTTLPANGIVTFTIDVRNSGPSLATGVQVGERLPTGATVLGTTPSKGSYNPATNVWSVGNLALNEVATLSLSVQLTGLGPFTNVAEVVASNQFDPDSTPNNSASSEDDQASATVGLGLAPAEADLELTKTVATLGKLPNSASFLISVVNKGPDTATNVEVSEQLPAGLALISAAPSQGSYDPAIGSWVIGSIPSGHTVTLNILTLVTAPPSQAITNMAQVSRSDQVDPDSTPGNGVDTEDDQASVSFTRLTAVTLTGLRAERQAKGVLVIWSTGTELNSRGFHIYRSDTGSRADAVKITPRLILARGDTSTGASYSFLDADALPDVSYSYWLVEQDSGGASSEFGPVSPASLTGGENTVYLPLVIR
ncbi:DUF11 domain-containing protein [Chloroflexales bacterium ZM16-3]|nr:DUF11 domain-containing protein [Chloroflexales bacterium ZM16-3]